MCGIVGYYNFKIKPFRDTKKEFECLMKEAFSRGKEASGIATLSKNNLSFVKSDINGKLLLKSSQYMSLVDELGECEIRCCVGHSRLATNGNQLLPENNQPVFSADNVFLMIHNGIITNTKEICELLNIPIDLYELDSKILLTYFSELNKKVGLTEAIQQVFNTIEGSASFSLIDLEKQEMILATNTGSLYYFITQNKETVFFASERVFLEKIIRKKQVKSEEIRHLKPNHLLFINQIESRLFRIAEFDLERANKLESLHVNIKDYSPKIESEISVRKVKFKNDINLIKKHHFDNERISRIKRCTKCILPVTTPFINFDAKGVCSYCREHKKIVYKGVEQLKKDIEKFKLKNNGEANCFAAFSGGRDSSYGLHFLKKELGLEPIAYTYDWGVLTDVGRENQAKIIGKLGVEHIVISADIAKKRKHIKQNIEAWMKNPQLGMVPLFTEGDKQCEFYADRLLKKYDLNLMFYFRGNELERDEFKAGHCGVFDADPNGVIHDLSFKNKAKLVAYYAGNYIKNPAYFNSSIFDTCLGFFSTYVQSHDYIYLWHYIPWDEKQIIETLQNEYNWKATDESKQTWRTDDGTSAFFFYIYQQVQGFTENDSFRSRQIREGILSRKEAMDLVEVENKPRYEALCWYFDTLGMDGDKVLSVVDTMKKMYD